MQKSLPFGKRRFRGKRGQENRSKAEKDQTKRVTGLGRRTIEEIQIEKWNQTDSPEIPDKARGKHQNRWAPFSGILWVVAPSDCYGQMVQME